MVAQEEDPGDQEDPEAPAPVRRYPSSRSIIRTAAMATTNSATKQEMVSARRKRVISKVRSGPFSFLNYDIPCSFSSRSVAAIPRCYEFLSIIALDLGPARFTMEPVNVIRLQLLKCGFHPSLIMLSISVCFTDTLGYLRSSTFHPPSFRLPIQCVTNNYRTMIAPN